jgi:NADH-quinone oxidoreductase subunit G
VRALSEVLGKKLPYDNLAQIRARMVEINPLFGSVDKIHAAEWKSFGKADKIDAKPFVSIVRNYYMTDPISRASETMAACTAEILGEGERTGTHG